MTATLLDIVALENVHHAQPQGPFLPLLYIEDRENGLILGICRYGAGKDDQHFLFYYDGSVVRRGAASGITVVCMLTRENRAGGDIYHGDGFCFDVPEDEHLPVQCTLRKHGDAVRRDSHRELPRLPLDRFRLDCDANGPTGLVRVYQVMQHSIDDLAALLFYLGRGDVVDRDVMVRMLEDVVPPERRLRAFGSDDQ